MEKRNSGKTGPTSPEGKAISCQNAEKHCVLSTRPLIEGEDPAARAQLEADWLAKYQPEDPIVKQFVLDVVSAEWHKRRALRQYDLLSDSLAEKDPRDWSADDQHRLSLLLRYKNSLERSFHVCYRILEQHLKIHRHARNNPEFDQDTEFSVEVASIQDGAIAQFIEIDGNNPYEAHRVDPTNQSVREWLHRCEEPLSVVERRYTFHNGNPPQYAWIEDHNLIQSINVEIWRKLVNREAQAANGLYLDPRLIEQATEDI